MKARQPGTPLRGKRELFCREYLIDMNGARAARAAGYKQKDPAKAGSEVLSFPEVQARIAELNAARIQRLEVDADRVLQEIDTVSLGDIGDILDFSGDGFAPTMRKVRDIPAAARRLIKSIQIKVQRARDGSSTGAVINLTLHDKMRALTLGAQHRGLLIPRDAAGDEIPETIHVIMVDDAQPEDGG